MVCVPVNPLTPKSDYLVASTYDLPFTIQQSGNEDPQTYLMEVITLA